MYNTLKTLKNKITSDKIKSDDCLGVGTDSNTSSMSFSELIKYLSSSLSLDGVAKSVDVYNRTELYTKLETDEKLNEKANSDNVYGRSELFTRLEIEEQLDDKANADDVFTRTEIDEKLNTKADNDSIYSKNDLYTKTELDTKLGDKSNAIDVYTKQEMTTKLEAYTLKNNAYTKNELDTKLGNKANSADVYTKTVIDQSIALLASKTSVYTKTELDASLNAKADADSTYSKTEIDEALPDMSMYLTEEIINVKLSAKTNTSDTYTKDELYTQDDLYTREQSKALFPSWGELSENVRSYSETKIVDADTNSLIFSLTNAFKLEGAPQVVVNGIIQQLAEIDLPVQDVEDFQTLTADMTITSLDGSENIEGQYVFNIGDVVTLNTLVIDIVE